MEISGTNRHELFKWKALTTKRTQIEIDKRS